MNPRYFKYMVIGISLLVGWAFWLVEAAVEAAFFGGGTFMEAAFTAVPSQQVYLRSVVMVFFMISGLLMLRLMAKREKAEMALDAEREKLAVTLRSIGDGVIAADRDGRIVLVNKMAEDLTGWHRKEALGRPVDDVYRLADGRTHTPCANPVAEVLASGTMVGHRYNTILLSPLGEERHITDICTPIRDGRDRIIGAVMVFNDITDTERMQAELMKTEKLEAVGILAGGIAHDFNNILTGILGNIGLAQRKAGTDTELTRILAETEDTVKRARDLTSQLLTFAKGGAPVKRHVETREFVRQSVDTAKLTTQVTCRFEIPDEAWPVSIDRNQVRQVLHDLLVNADQAMPHGGAITVGTENVTVDDPEMPLPAGRYIRLFIRDEGVGIPPENLQKVFDPFFSTRAMGSGLGLASAYSVIRKHRGHISVESTVGRGSTFSLYLPVAESQTPSLPHAAPAAVRTPKVLVMDDEDFIRTIAERILVELGYDVELAVDGREALSKYIQAQKGGKPFDAVIMDLTIPGGVGGEQAIKQLREVDPGVRAIVSSGYSTDPIMASYRDYGFAGCVCKPYEIEELETVLREVVEAV